MQVVFHWLLSSCLSQNQVQIHSWASFYLFLISFNLYHTIMIFTLCSVKAGSFIQLFYMSRTFLSPETLLSFSLKTHLPLYQPLHCFWYLLKLFVFISYYFTKEGLACCLIDLSTLKSEFIKLYSAFSRTLTLLIIQSASFRTLLFLLLLNPNNAISSIKWCLECYFSTTLQMCWQYFQILITVCVFLFVCFFM